MVTGNFTIRYLDGITSTGTWYEEYEPEGDGFGIRASATGDQFKFIYRYSFEGRRRTMTLIPYLPRPKDSKETKEKTTLPEARRRYADARAPAVEEDRPRSC